MANVALSQTNRPVIEEIAEQIVRLRPCWMEDVFEIAFRELVRKDKFVQIPEANPEFVKRILQVKKNDAEFIQWANERRKDKKEVTKQRIAEPLQRR